MKIDSSACLWFVIVVGVVVGRGIGYELESSVGDKVDDRV